MESLQVLQMIATTGTLVGMIFIVYKHFTQPDIEASQKIKLIEQGCAYKHGFLDEVIKLIQKDLHDIRVNHVDHIEDNQKKICEDIIEIKTMLNERLPRK